MKRLIVIGNSHVACLKQGWDRIRNESHDIDIVFFAHRGDKIGDLRPKGQSLIAPNEDLKSALAFTSGGKDTIEFSDADLVLLYGLRLRIPFDTGCKYSEQVQNQALKDQVKRSLCLKFIRKIRAISDIKVLVGHDPLPASGHDRPGTKQQYLDRIKAMNDLMFAPLNAELIHQPIQTVESGFQTNPKYTSNSTRLAIGRRIDNERHPDKDIRHMNAAFGELLLTQLFKKHLSIEIDSVPEQRTVSET